MKKSLRKRKSITRRKNKNKFRFAMGDEIRVEIKTLSGDILPIEFDPIGNNGMSELYRIVAQNYPDDFPEDRIIIHQIDRDEQVYPSLRVPVDGDTFFIIRTMKPDLYFRRAHSILIRDGSSNTFDRWPIYEARLYRYDHSLLKSFYFLYYDDEIIPFDTVNLFQIRYLNDIQQNRIDLEDHIMDEILLKIEEIDENGQFPY